jgi:ketosteroid isomerase-like protein
MSEAPFTADEIRQLRRLLEIEEIRAVRRLYSHFLDGGDLDALAEIFAVDAVCEFGPYGAWRGRDEIRRNYQTVWAETTRMPLGTLHNTVDHEIELTSETTAVGRSYLIDVVTITPKDENPIVWFGVYDDDYVKVDGRWLFARVSLQFLWPERLLSEGFRAVFPRTS